MRICHMEDLWILAGHTKQDYPFILAGCIADQQAYPQICDLELRMNSLMIPRSCHPVKLDLLLAAMLQSLAESVVIACCTIAVPHVAGLSGGILGDPASSPCSSAGLVENLPAPWSVVTFPGGPGLAQNVKIANLPALVQTLNKENIPDHNTLQRLAVYTKNMGADKFIAVTDGSGPGACGAALIRSKSQEVLWQLGEVDK